MVKLGPEDVAKIEAELNKNGRSEVTVKVESGKIVLLSVKKNKL